MLHLWLPINFSFLLVSVFVSTALYISNANSVRWQLFLGASLVSLPAFVLDTFVVAYSHKLTPNDFDQYVDCFDKLLGNPSFYVGRVYPLFPTLRFLSELAYLILPGAFVVVMMAYFLLRPVEEATRYVWTCILVLALAPLLYILFPACGPRFAFSGYPWRVPTFVIPHPVHLLATPNAIPSVHFSGCLLVWYFARRWRIGNVLSVIYTALVVWYILGTGEHYLFDVIVAVPYTALMVYLGSDTQKVIRSDTKKHVPTGPERSFISRISQIINRHLPEDRSVSDLKIGQLAAKLLSS